MLCDNCGKHEANVQYTEVINGEKRQMLLCQECSKKLGINNYDLDFPISFSSFFGDFLDDFEESDFLPTLDIKKEIKCNRCNMTFDEFMNTGKFGCSHCYKSFKEKIDPMLKKIHGNNHHIGRIGDIKNNNSYIEEENLKNDKNKHQGESNKKDNLEILKDKLKTAIKEERYEDAAKLRDEIKNQEK